MEKSRKLELTKLFKHCAESGIPSMVAIAKAASELGATIDELDEFLSLDKEEKMALYDEINKSQKKYTNKQLKMAAILRDCLNQDASAQTCMEMMMELTNSTFEECCELMALAATEQESLFGELDKILEKAVLRLLTSK